MIALAVALGLLSAPPPRLPIRDTLPEAVVLELRLGRVALRTVEAYRVADDALIPLSQFFDMAEVRATISPAGRVDGLLQPGNVPLTITLDADVATLGSRHVSVTKGRKLLLHGELYFSAAALGELLDAPMYVDWSDLEVVMRDAGPLPVAQQARRRAARAALLTQAGPANGGPPLIADRRPWDGFVLDYSFLAPSSDPVGGSSYAVQGGADLLGGSLELGASSLGRADVLLDARRLRYQRAVRAAIGHRTAAILRAPAARLGDRGVPRR